ncbi:MAG: FAD-dependent oxidoreductase [Promethearchaeota archaeon]
MNVEGLKVVIVGGVAAGASAATRLRRLDEKARILVLEKSPQVSYANCGLPYYVGGVIKSRDRLELVTPATFRDRFNVEVRVRHEVTAVDRRAKKVRVRDLDSGREYEEDYDALVLATGAKPVVPQLEGLELVPHFVLRNVPDAEAVESFVSTRRPREALVVGGGFVGLEVAENLVARGVQVTLVEATEQVMAPLDFEMAQYVHRELVLNGVDLVLGDAVERFEVGTGGRPVATTRSGKRIRADVVLLAVGVRPDSKLAAEAGLELDQRGHVLVDEHQRTSDPDVFAAGDVAATRHFQTGQPTPCYLAWPASKQGRVVADVLAGRESAYEGHSGTAVVRVFDLVVAHVGLNEKALRAAGKVGGRDYEKIHVHPNNHAGYFPGARSLAIKLIFEIPSGRVLGAQVVGGPGADKRVDVFSTVIRFGGTVFDLERLELAYSPPFGSAKDAVVVAGFVASNVLRGDVALWHWHDVDDVVASGGLVLDVRTAMEHAAGHVEGAKNLSDVVLREFLEELPEDKEKPVHVYCQLGYRGYLVTRLLRQLGYADVRNLSGGYETYRVATSTLDDFRELVLETRGRQEVPPATRPAEDSGVESDVVDVDAVGLSCPGPLKAMVSALKRLPTGAKVRVTATDAGFPPSARAWLELTRGARLLSLQKRGGEFVVVVRKEGPLVEVEGPGAGAGLPAAVAPFPTEGESEGETERVEDAVATATAVRSPPPPPKEGRRRPPGVPPASTIDVEELCSRMREGRGPRLVLDVRQPEEYHGPMGHVPTSKLIPLGELGNRLDEIREYAGEEVVTICHSGVRSMLAARLLVQAGFDYVRSLSGGMLAWRTEKCLPVSRE